MAEAAGALGPRFALRAARVVTSHGPIEDGVVVVESGRIRAVVPHAERSWDDLTVLHYPHATLLPGMIDIHVHGYGGWRVGSEDAAEAAVVGMARELVNSGVTGFLPTVATAPDANTVGALAAIASQTATARPDAPGARVFGSHLEGPYLNPVRKGAMRADLMRHPDPAHFETLWEAAAGTLRSLTLAPELPGADGLIDTLVAHGVVVSAGHTDAESWRIHQAIERGVGCITHLFNAMRGLHHREPGVVGAALRNGAVSVELIADGVHVHPEVLQLALRCKGSERVVVVSDTGRYAGMPSGTYQEMDRTIVVDGVRCSFPDGTLAGSASPMNRNVRVLREEVGCSWSEIARMTATNPANLIGVGQRTGTIAEGFDADLFLLDDQAVVLATFVLGQPVYRAPAQGAQG